MTAGFSYRGICRALVLALACSLPFSLHAQAHYTLEYPFTKSADAGASFHLLLHREITSGLDLFLPSELFSGERLISDAGNMAYRILLLGTEEFYLTYIPVVNQHEYFGHLARAKQFNAGYTRYEIYLFPPSGGRAYYSNHLSYQLTNPERTVEMAGGIEATRIMAEMVTQNVIQKGRINFHESMLFLGSASDLAAYLLFEDASLYNDIDQYLLTLNQDRPYNAGFEKHDLVLPATLSFISHPMTIRSALHLLLDYVYKGNKESKFLMFNSEGRIAFLPFVRFSLHPQGPVLSVNSYIETGGQLYKLSIGHGYPREVQHTKAGLSAYSIHIIPHILSADLNLRGWTGSGFLMHDKDGNLISSGNHGALCSADLFCRLPFGPFGGRTPFVTGGLYIKTNGYSTGYPLNKGIGFRMGLGFFIGV